MRFAYTFQIIKEFLKRKLIDILFKNIELFPTYTLKILHFQFIGALKLRSSSDSLNISNDVH